MTDHRSSIKDLTHCIDCILSGAPDGALEDPLHVGFFLGCAYETAGHHSMSVSRARTLLRTGDYLRAVEALAKSMYEQAQELVRESEADTQKAAA